MLVLIDINHQAWAPLVRGYRFTHPSITTLANKYEKDAAQILLRYSLQKVKVPCDGQHGVNRLNYYLKGYIPLPKSSFKNRITSNAEVFDFELTSNEISQLDALDEGRSLSRR